MSPRAVFLDSGGVIARLEAPRHVIFARAARELGQPVEEARVKAAFEAADRFQAENEALLLEDPSGFDGSYQQVLYREAGLGAPEPSIQERYDALLQRKEYRSIYPDVVPALEELRRSGYRLGLISNAHPDLRKLLALFDLLAYFDTAVISGEVGFPKPDPRIFRRALEGVGVPPSAAVHVGDDPLTDYAGALRAGLHAILVDRHDTQPGRANPRIPDLFSLADTVEALPLDP